MGMIGVVSCALALGTAAGVELVSIDIVANGASRLSVTGAEPGSRYWVVASETGPGIGPCPDALGGGCLGIQGPFSILGTFHAHDRGLAGLDFTVPSETHTTTLWLQAVSDDGSVSPVVPSTVRSAPLAGNVALVDAAAAWFPTTNREASVGAQVDLADIDGDGLAEIIIGAPNHGYQRGADPGRSTPAYGFVEVFDGDVRGQAGHRDAIAAGEGRTAHENYGGLVFGPGDVSGDGFGDLLVGAGEAELHLFHGPLPQTLDSLAPDATLHRSSSLEAPLTGTWVGDTNGDGIDDLLVGSGNAVVLLTGPIAGSAALDRGHRMATRRSDGPHTSISGPGDVDGDGLDDVLLGGGGAWLFHGPIQTSDVGGADAHFTGATGDRIGGALSAAGDLDGDGIPDMLISQNDATTVVWMVSGQSDGGALATVSHAAIELDRSIGPGQVGTAGDLDGDGHSEVLISTDGGTYLFYGPFLGSVSTADAHATFPPNLALPRGSGDVDGDGLDDLLLGDPSHGARSAHDISLSAGTAWLMPGG